jgi:hypothetical protein
VLTNCSPAHNCTSQVADSDASEAAYRLADISQPLLFQPNKHPFSVSSEVTTNAAQHGVPSPADAAAAAAEPTALDYTGRSTLALEVQRMCHLLLQSVQIPPRFTANEGVKKHRAAPSNAAPRNDNDGGLLDLSEAGNKGGAAQVECSVLPTSWQAPAFNPWTYTVISWFQAFVFKCNLYRYAAARAPAGVV